MCHLILDAVVAFGVTAIDHENSSSVLSTLWFYCPSMVKNTCNWGGRESNIKDVKRFPYSHLMTEEQFKNHGLAHSNQICSGLNWPHCIEQNICRSYSIYDAYVPENVILIERLNLHKRKQKMY